MSETYTGETEQTEEPRYIEYPVASFQEAVERIIYDDDEENAEPRYILLDIDGVLLPDEDKLPIVSLMKKSKINDVDQGYIMHLKERYNDNIAIVTDRDPIKNIFLSSKYIIDQVKEVNYPKEEPIPIHDSLLKQVPIMNIERKKLIAKGIAEKFKIGDVITLTSIEDKTFTHPDRKGFLTFIADELYKEYGIECIIRNYVVQTSIRDKIRGIKDKIKRGIQNFLSPKNGIIKNEDQNNNSSDPSWNLLYHRLISSK